MIATIFGALTSRMAGPIATAVAVALALALGWQTFQLSMTKGALKRSQAQVEKVEKDLRTCQSNVATLDEARKRQNAAVAALKRDGDARVAESAKAVSAARKTADGYRKEAARILAAKAGPDACASADALILGEVGK